MPKAKTKKVADKKLVSEPDDLAIREIQAYDVAKGLRSAHDDIWDGLKRFVVPEEAYTDGALAYADMGYQHGIEMGLFDSIFDTTAARANWIQANGSSSQITGPGAPWASFEPPRALRGDEPSVRW